MLNRIMAANPWIEVAIRTAYWRSPAVHALLSKFQNRTQPAEAIEPVPDALPRLIAAIGALGVVPGDILIVHSELNVLRRLGVRPAEVNAALLDLLGPKGTLAMPAYPLFTDQPQGWGRMYADMRGTVTRYDPRRTPIWTGLLPHALMRTPGARRSAMPINSLVALGPHADAMFAHELEGERLLPCGRQSAWYYCYEQGAKVLGLGLDLAHSLTMNHTAEDSYADEWPVAGWYRDRRFEIVMPDKSVIEVRIGEREPHWAMNYAERTLAKDLRAAGLLRETDVDGIHLEFLDAREHIGFLNARKASHYPYYIFPFQKTGATPQTEPAERT